VRDGGPFIYLYLSVFPRQSIAHRTSRSTSIISIKVVSTPTYDTLRSACRNRKPEAMTTTQETTNATATSSGLLESVT
jgi:hypothetical protein